MQALNGGFKVRNIDIFNLFVAEVLGQCYEDFPIESEFEIESLALTVVDKYLKDDESDPPDLQELTRFGHATTSWLEKAGYLWIRRKEYGVVTGVTLTPKSLELLNATPSSLEAKKSAGTVLASESKKMGREAVLAVIGAVLSEGAKLAIPGSI